MPVIPEMEEFVNWDQAAPAAGVATDMLSPSLTGPTGTLNDLDLALENVDADDFSFWALQHFENSHNFPVVDPPLGLDLSLDTSPMAFEDSFDLPDMPCTKCQSSGYHCKRINEGKYKGYCTSCVALRCACSFGLADPTPYPTDSAFPHNPWPVMGDHPDAITQEDGHNNPLGSGHDNIADGVEVDNDNVVATNQERKAGARFSRESVKILKNWLSTHSKHPYPNDEEKKMLQRQTGLDKTQITNWLANARRRKKIIAPRSTSPGVRTWANAIDIPVRVGTPASFEHMNPLQRWQNSPPENEPASVTAIARAVTASSSSNISSGLNSPFSHNFTDDGSGRSLCALSSASSLDNSFSSGGSFASAYSRASRGSFGSFNSIDAGRRRRRRKVSSRRTDGKQAMSTPLPSPPKSFQCTFCTETFRTKHDWQRHEKSLHLSLERWVCTPEGARAFNPENGQISCVFCGEANPDEAHVEGHNHSACQERSLGERTFYRKDHLRQHLKLVHNVKFITWSMEQWKVATPEIRSRCGFCGIVMDTWTIRVDHLAEHFKSGRTMADWQGDWGFDAPVLDMVENSIPPYLIHDERNSPYPYEATQASPETARNAYELLKSELMFYITNEREIKGVGPTDEELQIEACRIIFGAEVLSKQTVSSNPSWLRELILSSDDLSLRARLAPIRSQKDSRQTSLNINGKENIFDDDPMEQQLHEYVKARRLLGLTAMDSELQSEACNIIGRMEESSDRPSDEVANFLLRLIFTSPKFLRDFRQRALLPRSEDMGNEATRSTDPSSIDSTIHNYSRLETELADFVRVQRTMGVEPSDIDLQKQAGITRCASDDGWNQTAADNAAWLSAFKQRHISSGLGASTLASNEPITIASVTRPTQALPTKNIRALPTKNISGLPTIPGNSVKVGPFFFNDANCYRRLSRELNRWVQATMSPNNPNSHIPTDGEIQHQARWVLYDDDDPWNQTAADNAEWLQRFKRDAGIITDPSIPGLPEGNQWCLTQGGSGFAPPYAVPNPKAQVAPFQDERVPIHLCDRLVTAESSTASKYIKGLAARPQMATVFCSRELEAGLVEFVESEISLTSCGGGRIAAQAAFPSDEALRAKARDILKMPQTAADDAVLLEKFKRMTKAKLGLSNTHSPSQTGILSLNESPSSNSTCVDLLMPGVDFSVSPEMDLNLPDFEMNDILQDIDFDFTDLSGANDPTFGDMSRF